MKKILVTVACTVLVLTGCKTTDYTVNRVGWSNYAEIAVKDYETVGVVTLESQEVFEAKPLGLARSLKGSRIVWSDLMAEAVKLGADDIINVRIEVTDQNKRTLIDFLTGYTLTYNYKGTALAIKYTGAVEERIKSEGATRGDMYKSGPMSEFYRN